MRRVFADTVYWIALANPKDQWHALAVKTSQALGRAEIVTTEEVLSEFLNHFSGRGRAMRGGATRFAASIVSDPDMVVHAQSHQSFLAGWALYVARPDKEYSMTDCISMETMRREALAEILTHDAHFTQEGFIILM